MTIAQAMTITNTIAVMVAGSPKAMLSSLFHSLLYIYKLI
jgi:hypothetical protein